MKKPQVTTNIGTAGLFTHFLTIFNDVKDVDFIPYLKAITIGEIYLALVPFLLFGWAIYHDEDEGVKIL